ncbi:MAG TPA: hemerythrin domain-containing protein [Burkholderiaceae bacterium]
MTDPARPSDLAAGEDLSTGSAGGDQPTGCAGESQAAGCADHWPRDDVLDALDVLAEGMARSRALAEECRRFARHVTPDARMPTVAEALCRAVRRLAVLEEELFYPAAREALAGSPVVDLAALEHATARQIIARMQETDPRSPCYEALVVALADCVDRHARHERSELFPRLREAQLDLASLAAAMHARRRELEAMPMSPYAALEGASGASGGGSAGTVVA